jgi:tripartite-type tricarboxylate transporter receptor subunit TctC
MKTAWKLVGMVLAAAVIAAPRGWAQPVEQFYRGKTIQLIVGSAAGGGYDAYTRALARFMGKHIPGRPNFVVVNMPGGSSLQAVRYLKSVAAKDGTQILMPNRTLINLSVMDPALVGIDFNDFTWIGSMTGEIPVCYLSSTKGISSVTQLKDHNVTVGDTSKNGGTYVYSAILRNVFGSTVKQVMGYSTTANVWLAMDKGEIDGNCTGWTSIRIQRPQWLDGGKINVLVQFSTRRHPDLKGVPEIYDLNLTESQRRAIQFLTIADAMVRPLVAAAGIPSARAAALRDAFKKTMEDPEFRAFANQTKMDLDPLWWEETEKIVREVTSAPPETVALARKIIE